MQDEPHPGASDSFRGDSVLESHAGAVASPAAVRGADALSPVLSPTSPTSDTEHTTGTNNTNNFFRVELFSRFSLYKGDLNNGFQLQSEYWTPEIQIHLKMDVTLTCFQMVTCSKSGHMGPVYGLFCTFGLVFEQWLKILTAVSSIQMIVSDYQTFSGFIAFANPTSTIQTSN